MVRPSGPQKRPGDLAAHLAASAMFLTRIPLPQSFAATSPLSEAMWAFPVVGALIGAAGGTVLAAGIWLGLPALAAAGLAVAAMILMTGGLHEDGLADAADGFGGGASRERKLEIMRDSRIGSYGVIALVIALLVKAAALQQIAARDWGEIAAAMATAGALSRAVMVWLMALTPPARPSGLSAGAGRPTAAMALRAMLIAVAFAVIAGLVFGAFAASLISVAVAVLAMLAVRHMAMRQIGGQTGDVCGAVQVIAETSILLAFAATLH